MQSNEGFHETKEPMTFNITHILIGCVNKSPFSLPLSIYLYTFQRAQRNLTKEKGKMAPGNIPTETSISISLKPFLVTIKGFIKKEPVLHLVTHIQKMALIFS